MQHPHALTFFLLAGTACAQTYVVDASGGGNFLDLPQAIAAVPNGAVLRVRSGTYSAFTLVGKSLTIIGDAPQGAVRVMPSSSSAGRDVTIGPTTTAQKVVLKSVTFMGLFDQSYINVRLSNLAGPVWLEDVDCLDGGKAPCNVTIDKCADAHLVRFSLQGNYAPMALTIVGSSVELVQSHLKPGPGLAMRASSSRVVLVSSGVFGGAQGSPGIVAAGSTLHAYGGATIAGGANTFGQGGTGIEASTSSLFLVGVTPIGGAGTTPGLPLKLDALSSVRTLATTGPSCTITGTPLPGNAVTLDLLANGGAVATLLIGQEPLFVPAPGWLTLGTLFVNPLVTFGAFTVPAAGRLSISLQLPSTLPRNELFLLQCAVLPGVLNEIWMSNATSILVRS